MNLLLRWGVLCSWMLLPLTMMGQSFDTYFETKALRLDFTHSGNAHTEAYAFERLLEEPYWAGSKTTLIDPLPYGNQQVRLYDLKSGKLIFSKGYCTLFNEWQTTPEATLMTKSYREAVRFPLPKDSVRVEFLARNRQGAWVAQYSQKIDPRSFQIQKFSTPYECVDLKISGPTDRKIDILVLGDGYTMAERDRFLAEAKKLQDAILSYSPFKERADQFNFRAVFSPSPVSGVTNPGAHEWRTTPLQSKYWTLESERYIMVDDYQRVCDIAASAPYDYIYILANTDKYGGGGIYNFYAIGAASHPTAAEKVHVHEFGHLFIGLGDEYQGDAAYSDFYPEGVEPWEANLTRRIGFEAKPWAQLVKPGTPIPTPLNYTLAPGYAGLYEGGGYLNQGIYRPAPSCMMRDLVEFCPVCQQALRQAIDLLTR
jgi:hypothetical protein